MVKKTIVAGALALLACLGLAAEEKAAAPAYKPGIELVQFFGVETNDGLIAKCGYGDDAILSRSEIKGKVDCALGEKAKLTPWFKNRFELKNNGSADTDLSPYVRNRLYAGLDLSLALDKAFNLALSLEYRSGTAMKNSSNTAVDLSEERFAPYLTISGAVGDLSYSLVEDFPIYLDRSVGDRDNASDDLKYDLEGTYSVGYSLKLGEIGLKIELIDYLGLYFPSIASSATDADPTMSDDLRLKASFALKDVKPFVGFFYNTALDNQQEATLTVIGGTFGADLSAGSLSFSLSADLGVNTEATDQPLVSKINASVKIK